MKRRALPAGLVAGLAAGLAAGLGAILAPSTEAGAQQSLPVVGYLSAASAGDHARLSAFRPGLEDQGFGDSRNITIDYRHADGQYDRLASMAAGFVRLPVAVIMASALPAALAAKQATTATPIVFVSGADPVQLGLVASLRRPGGNAT